MGASADLPWELSPTKSCTRRQTDHEGHKRIEFGGVIYTESAEKAARFIMDCNQNLIPLIFFHDVNGFMVGRDAEWSGIIKAGAKMVNAVSNSVVPKITVIVGGSFGAGHYAMCGKAFDPRFVFAWPTARYAVMSGDSAAGTLVEIKVKQLERGGTKLSEEEKKELYESVKRTYDEQTDPRYGAARLWIDKIIDPIETREAITQALEAAALNPEVAGVQGGSAANVSWPRISTDLHGSRSSETKRAWVFRFEVLIRENPCDPWQVLICRVVKLIECPRDAWQGLKGQIPPDIKRAYLQALISAGFKHIDAVSFVSPKAVPQMADSEEVLKELDPPDDVEIIGIVVNEKGAQRAIETHAVHTLGFPYSISETFLAQESESVRRKMRSTNWRRFRKKPTMPRSTLWSISRWRLAIRMAICGTWRK